MSSAIWLVRATLVLNFALAGYGTWYLFLNNGAAARVNDVLATKVPTLPGTVFPLKTSYTGVKIVDEQLTVLTIAFWEVVDGSMPNLSLYSFMFAGKFGSLYLLFLAESVRKGNRGRVVSLTVLFGLLAQRFTVGCTMPLYALLHLTTSSTVSAKSASDIAVDASSMAVAPFSIALGFIIPAVVMSLPAPSTISVDSKQAFIALWQVFPLTVSMLQLLLPFVYRLLSSSKPAGKSQDSATLNALRLSHFTALLVSSVTQVATFTVVGLNTLFPDLFVPQYRGVFNLSKVLTPASLTTSFRPSTIGEGTLLLIQFDEMSSMFAVMIWSVYLFFQADDAPKSVGRWVSLIAGASTAYTFAGASGVAIAAIWGRDELVFSKKNANAHEKVQ